MTFCSLLCMLPWQPLCGRHALTTACTCASRDVLTYRCVCCVSDEPQLMLTQGPGYAAPPPAGYAQGMPQGYPQQPGYPGAMPGYGMQMWTKVTWGAIANFRMFFVYDRHRANLLEQAYSHRGALPWKHLRGYQSERVSHPPKGWVENRQISEEYNTEALHYIYLYICYHLSHVHIYWHPPKQHKINIRRVQRRERGSGRPWPAFADVYSQTSAVFSLPCNHSYSSFHGYPHLFCRLSPSVLGCTIATIFILV